jgi:hypothetical protein
MDRDRQPFIEVKKARIARAGTQFYLAQEVEDWGFHPPVKKPVYAEYKPAEVVIRNLDKFNNIPFVNNHTPVDVSPQNWKDYAIGFVSGNAAVEVTDSGEIFVTNDVVFYDEAAYEQYKAGKVELSASSRLKKGMVKDAEGAGYDFIVTDVLAVNHVALVDRARAGRSARVLDSMYTNTGPFGEVQMFGKLFELLGVVKKTQDSAFKLSDAVFAGVAKVGKVDDAALDAEIMAVLEHIKPLGSGEHKDMLIAVVADSFKNASEVLAGKEKVAAVIDGLYLKCQTEDAEKAQAVLDAIKEKKDVKEGDNKDADPADVQKIVDAAVAKVMDGMSKGLAGMVDESVKQILGVTKETRTVSAAAATVNDGDIDVSDMIRDIWGRM